MFEETLKKIASTLKIHGIPYMVIGGQAVLLYGEPRMTRDIDITLGVSIDSLAQVVQALENTGLVIIPESYKDFVNNTSVLPIKDEETNIRIDLIFSFTPYESQAIERSREVNVAGGIVNFISLEDLIIHKLFSGRPRDMEDVRTILIKNSEFDAAYIEMWLKEFDNALEGKNLTEVFRKLVEK